MLISHHPSAETAPIAAGESLAGCSTPPEQLAGLFEAGRKYRSFKYWDKVRVGSSESHITGQGFNAVKFDPRKPARTVRRNDGNLGMHGAMHWTECRRFSLPEFKRFGSFPDEFCFAGEFEEGIRQIGNCVPPLFMRAISRHIRENILAQISSGERAARTCTRFLSISQSRSKPLSRDRSARGLSGSIPGSLPNNRRRPSARPRPDTN